MTDEIRLPRETMTTLGAAFTKDALVKVKRIVQKLQDAGKSEKEILSIMRHDLPDFPSATRNRLYALAVGRKVADDFKSGEVTDQKAVKKDTLEVQLKAPRPDLVSGSLVHYLGADWYVSRIYTDGDRFVLRRLT